MRSFSTVYFALTMAVIVAAVGCAGSTTSDTQDLPVPTADANSTKPTRPPMPEDAGPTDEDAPKEYTKTESGLEYRILRKSDGKKPTLADNVYAHYHGWLTDGTVFDSSYQRGEPSGFPLNGVIDGWKEGLQLIGEGGMIELKIPSDLGYGTRGAPPDIGPDETLYFLVELKEVR